jgi:peptidoglycan/LPS O-acetylase OafA/YrhL
VTVLTLWSDIWPYIAALIPTVGIAFLFYVVVKNMIEADRKERHAQAKWEAEQDQLNKEPATDRENGAK